MGDFGIGHFAALGAPARRRERSGALMEHVQERGSTYTAEALLRAGAAHGKLQNQAYPLSNGFDYYFGYNHDHFPFPRFRTGLGRLGIPGPSASA